MSGVSGGLHCGLPLLSAGIQGVHGQLRDTVQQEIVQWIFYIINIPLSILYCTEWDLLNIKYFIIFGFDLVSKEMIESSFNVKKEINFLFFRKISWKFHFSGKKLHHRAKCKKADPTYNSILLPVQHHPTHWHLFKSLAMAWFDCGLTFTHFYLVTSNFALQKDEHHDLSENVKMIMKMIWIKMGCRGKRMTMSNWIFASKLMD